MMSLEARHIFGTLQSKVRGGVASAQQLDLREIATHELNPYENAWRWQPTPCTVKKMQTAAVVEQSREPRTRSRLAAAVLEPSVQHNARIMPRRCSHPSWSKGEPNGAPWTMQKWTGDGCIRVDFDRLEESKTTSVDKTMMSECAARALPADSTLLKQHQKPKLPIQSPFNDDDCLFCKFRPKQSTAQPWLNGTGEGGHNPMYCTTLKRYLAEGGEPSNNQVEKNFLQGCLRYTCSTSST